MDPPARDMIAVGTSGWAYDDWRGRFYPTDLPKKHWFEHYANVFPTVEINYSFYRLPSEATIERWRAQAPPGFRFALKGSRLITHVRRLRDCQDALATFIGRVEALRARLGVVLWQLPPTLERDVDRLVGFLRLLPRRIPHAVEFRHRSWLHPEVFALLEERGVAHVHVSSSKLPKDLTVTASPVYVRYHGVEGGSAHDYSSAELRPWVGFLRAQAAAGHEGFAFFNNDARARAPANAAALIDTLGNAARLWPARRGGSDG